MHYYAIQITASQYLEKLCIDPQASRRVISDTWVFLFYLTRIPENINEIREK